MTERTPKNLAASVHQRLLNRARADGRPFAELLQHYAMERFLYRLSKSPHAPRFVLKGALMLRMWGIPRSRPTKDIDFLGQTDNSVDSVVTTVSRVCLERVEPDGMAFDPSTVAGGRITEGADYEGVRVRFSGSLGNARVTMQLDIAFGDAVVPAPQVASYPTILDFPPPRLKAYSRESTIAEKLEAMVRLGLLNSRMKDFFDTWLLSARFDFAGATLSDAIAATFEARRTEIPREPVALTRQFSQDASRKAQWRAFVQRGRIEDCPPDLHDVVICVGTFLGPVLEALSGDRTFNRHWKPGGPWQSGHRT